MTSNVPRLVGTNTQHQLSIRQDIDVDFNIRRRCVAFVYID